ncbi:DUF1775 domain-containing protein [Actinomadura sp. NPDC000600]|uniref:DUF1775 domain-containing protein n=1 Tax=Actinomadura sp. NPDC000600 TaxID=3154262 RepID=UPI003398D197
MERTRPTARRNRLPGLATAAAIGAGMVMPLSAPASAHVRVLSEGAEAGKPATLQFRVPSEKEFSTTVRVDVTLPEGVTAGSVPVDDGWTINRTGGGKGGPHVVWTAQAGHEIKPADTHTFTVRVNPLPDEAVLRFDTAQTYSDGSVVNWNQPATGGQEPDFPAPELVLDPAAVSEPPSSGSGPEGGPHPAVSEGSGPSAAPQVKTAADTSDGQDISLVVWAVAGTLAAVGLIALVRRLKRPSTGRHG